MLKCYVSLSSRGNLFNTKPQSINARAAVTPTKKQQMVAVSWGSLFVLEPNKANTVWKSTSPEETEEPWCSSVWRVYRANNIDAGKPICAFASFAPAPVPGGLRGCLPFLLGGDRWASVMGVATGEKLPWTLNPTPWESSWWEQVVVPQPSDLLSNLALETFFFLRFLMK